MSRHLLLSFCLLLPQAYAEEKAAAPSPHDLAYSLGASLGERLRQEVPDLQLKALIEGLQQAYKNKPLSLSDERIGQILSQHEAQVNQVAVDAQTEKWLGEERRFMTTERAHAGVRELANGILMTELNPGQGTLPHVEGRVQVRYIGKRPDGSVFDQSSQPQWFRLDSVIDGWQTALVHMPVGAKWRLVIPSAQAYGAEGAGDLIAPFTPLVFEIELLGVAD
ncbi:FKBP-type peptidyl-prolyl cis-trans isomerase [Pseudomonas sp. R5(2019)]|uniref:FKBP-type peptidyl-prolyl cis-trans isomerase n=1 Tax=Pseudomonas sp. R5(2019) TaxID=2697566 RepID=UPI0014128689|nr:FKBP-type peptidyl-prolyl cis-trans isomerase [Pseudomonas sp. R5(2019)]NBA94349.1 FKBP-type peptidyl-prolyl cis-trans isomerase [Pseudomonas sp. R5(2019)]